MSLTQHPHTPRIPSTLPPYEGSCTGRISSRGYLKLPQLVIQQSMKRFEATIHTRDITTLQDLTLLLGYIPTWYIGGLEHTPQLLSDIDAQYGNCLHSKNAPYFYKVDLTKSLELNLNRLPQLIYARNVRLTGNGNYFSLNPIQCSRT